MAREEEEEAAGAVLVTAGVISKDFGRSLPRPPAPLAVLAGVAITVAIFSAETAAEAGVSGQRRSVRPPHE